MKILPLDLADRRQVNDFLRLPFRIYQDIPQWVPPLQMDERRRLDMRHYPFYKHSQAAFLLAYQDGQPMGRLAVLDCQPYNQFNKTKSSFFYMFECMPDPEAAAGLFEAGFDWSRRRGLTEMLGPKGFTPLDGFGLLVRGFEHRPAFGIPYNPEYYMDLIERQGFATYAEALSGYLSPGTSFPQNIHQLAERLAQRRGLRIAQCETRAELRKLIPAIKELYNASIEGTTDNMPLTDEEVSTLAGQILWLADPRLIKLVMKGEQVVGFMFAYPDVSAALQTTRGRLFPFGWLSVLLELRRTDWININGAGLLPEFRGSGGSAILYSEMFKAVSSNPRYRHVDIVQIGVENDKMQREMRNFGVDFYKTHRMVHKTL